MLKSAEDPPPIIYYLRTYGAE